MSRAHADQAGTRADMFEALQQQALALGVCLRPPPCVPTTCCGRGCHGCVWEGFYDAARFWREDAEQAIHARSK